MKKIFGIACALWLSIGLTQAQNNLVANGSFEDYSCNLFGCSFDDWNMPLGSGTAEGSDKLDGNASLCLYPTSVTANLDQGVTLTDAVYAPGTLFALTIHYKVLSLPDNASISLDCYWEPSGGGDAEAMKLHDADVLQRPIATAVSSEWEELTVVTSKPASSAYFRVRVKVPKNAKVLFDAFDLEKTENTEPFIHVTPATLSSVETTLGNSVNFATVHIEQGNVEGTTTFELSGYDPQMFSLSRTSLTADESECDLIITYTPTAAGTHTALLNIDNLSHTVLFQSIKLTGSCTDPSQQPAITVTPNPVPDFAAQAGKVQTQTITVSSVNCTDYVYLSVNHIQGAAFTIDATMLSKNTPREVEVRFAPNEEGTYQSTVTITSANAESVVLTLNGTATKGGDTPEWANEFVWDDSNPLTMMLEPFDNVSHNEPLAIEGWQNVAPADQRPWWGFDETQTSLFEGDGKYAKATAYQWAKPSTGLWEMWLVTPALDYKNTVHKIFAFSVMGQYLADEGNQAFLEIYYIDATDPTNVFKQDLTESFPLPSTSDDNEQWFSFYMDLSPYSQTMADVFHMAFRYEGPNGDEGAVTYYIDNVSWGLQPEGIEQISQTPTANRQKLLRDGQLIIVRDGVEYSAQGIRL